MKKTSDEKYEWLKNYSPHLAIEKAVSQNYGRRTSNKSTIITALLILAFGVLLFLGRLSSFTQGLLDFATQIHPKIDDRIDHLMRIGGIMPYFYLSALILFPVAFTCTIVIVSNHYRNEIFKTNPDIRVTRKFVWGAFLALLVVIWMLYFVFLNSVDINGRHSSHSSFVLATPVFIVLSAAVISGSATALANIVTLLYLYRKGRKA